MDNKREIIIEYLKNNKDIPNLDKRFLISYFTKLKYIKKEPVEQENIQTIVNDLKYYNSFNQDSVDNPITRKRLAKELELIDMVLNSTNDIDIDYISYELDKLYIESDMPIRKISHLIKILEKKDNNNESRINKR